MTEATRAGVGNGAGLIVLVTRARAGDVDAFDRIVATKIDVAYRTARAVLRHEADAHDAVQETFFQVWRDLPKLRKVDRFDAWLGRILMNRCRSVLRSRRSVLVHEVPADNEESPAAELPDRATAFTVHHAEADAVRRAFDRLDDDARQLLAFHHIAGHGIADLARMTSAPAGTVKWRLHAARQALERALEAERR